MHKTYDVFLAYASPDRDVAAQLVSELQKRGLLVSWDGNLVPDESFDTSIPQLIASSRVFAVLVSSLTWDGQQYASEELAAAIQYARRSEMSISPVWLQPMAIEKRPYGIGTRVGISFDEYDGCMGCIAGRLVEVVLRAQLMAAAAAITRGISRASVPDLPTMVNPAFFRKQMD